MIFRIIILTWTLNTILFGATVEELQNQQDSLARNRKRIEELKSVEPNVAIPELGEILRKTAKQNIYQAEERWEVHRLAKEALLGIPGHARYYLGYMEKEREAMLKTLEEGGKGRYSFRRSICFDTLRYMPTLETVEMLGGLLEDTRDEPTPEEQLNFIGGPTNSLQAATALGHLIEKPPVTRNPPQYLKSDVETWKLWYAQVKAGNREFQFKGDPRVYKFPVPAKEDQRRPGRETPRTPTASPPTTAPKPPASSGEAAAESKIPWPWIAGSGAILALAAWLALSRPRKRNP